MASIREVQSGGYWNETLFELYTPVFVRFLELISRIRIFRGSHRNRLVMAATVTHLKSQGCPIDLPRWLRSCDPQNYDRQFAV